MTKKMKRKPLRLDQIAAAENLRTIWQARKSEGVFKTQDDLVSAIESDGIQGWSQALISQHLNAITAISAYHVGVYARYLRIDDPMVIASNDVRSALEIHSENKKRTTLDSNQFIIVRRHVLQPWTQNTNGENMEKGVAFLKSYAESADVAPSNLIAFTVIDGALAPQMSEGDTVVGRTDRLTVISDNAVYAFEYENRAYLRRVSEQDNGGLLVTSDNAAYGERPFYISPQQRKTVKILAEIFHRAGNVI